MNDIVSSLLFSQDNRYFKLQFCKNMCKYKTHDGKLKLQISIYFRTKSLV